MELFKYSLFLVVLFFGVVICYSDDDGEYPEREPVEEVVSGNNEFAIEVYGKLRAEKEGNLFFSPYSISTALAMTYAGARSQTGIEMGEVLHFPVIEEKGNFKKGGSKESEGIGRDVFHRIYGQVSRDLNKRGKKGNYELSVANALWGQEGYKFLEEYIELVETSYGGKLESVDFVEPKRRELSRQRINKWVEEQTNEKIKELIKKGSLDELVRLILTNAIYFKGKWADEFKEKWTRDERFSLDDGGEAKADLMHREGKYRYYETEDMQLLELAYKGEEVSMLVLLPKEKVRIETIEEQLKPANLHGWVEKLAEQEVDVFLPRFKITSEFQLGEVLKSMGMRLAFSGSADFSGMTGKKDLFISAVIHKAFVEVNEEGTEAAAATGVAMRLTAVVPRPVVFRADRPFLFLIRDKVSGSILFIGRLMKPVD